MYSDMCCVDSSAYKWTSIYRERDSRTRAVLGVLYEACRVGNANSRASVLVEDFVHVKETTMIGMDLHVCS